MRLHLALRLLLLCTSAAPLLARADVPVSPHRSRPPPPPPPPDPAWGGIEGKIVKQDTKFPVAGVDVTVRGGAIDRTEWTDLDGRYKIPGLPPGEYKLTIRWHDATHEHPTPVRVSDHQTLTLDLFAPPPPPPPPPAPPSPPPPPRKPVPHTPEPGSPLARWLRCRVLQSYREGAEIVVFLDKGEADGVRTGTGGLLLDAYEPGYEPVPGSQFTITRLLPGGRAQARIKNLRTLGKNVDCLLDTAGP